ncbi:MAG: carbon-nitrogen hydrolase family protein [Nitrososphaerota archaeon]|jgi:predicted amidohydrolase|nr:carbon-nitrogen hydrolase family protein [Nitrososphaerota archaeon]MDG6928198.1 carbon-nitrogen hydrolase family protein [Nitrososphaerota archaeon]MDG6930971.1 carbon-nitrogen hydrolase family protein [Nitrososphaerota archaeon]MDG6932016.1 carbon-nitrogen hydrolase family protein [Nitrososphaerota archaeon]MDG6935640.1 carbon-nitrogen hydrolase family protein [Nitrososphaerota archaeon]
MQKLRVALAQFSSTPSTKTNLGKALNYIKIAAQKSAQLVVFPEYTNIYAEDKLDSDSLYKIAEYDDSPFLREIKAAAADMHVAAVIGVYEKGKRRPEVYSTAYFIQPDGKILAKYSKSHLFEAFGSSETNRLIPSGDRPAIFEFMGFKFGIIICYEIRFPELARLTALLGIDALIVPSAWYKGYNKEDQWETLVKARAMENTIYILTSNQIGNSFTGITMAADPAGIIVARATEEEGLVFAELSKERIKKVRDSLPLLKQRRPELYS